MKIKRIVTLILALVLAAAMIPAMADGILRRGDTGEQVFKMQARLRELGYLETDPTGVFDEATEAALIAFQARNGLLRSGMGDERTLAALFAEDARGPYRQDPAAGDFSVNGMDAVFETDEAAVANWSYAAPAATAMPAYGAAERGWMPPAWNTDEYAFIRETGFQSTATAPLSTFAADVDTASYAQLRSMILQGRPVPRDAVRIEEMLNYFHYDYRGPAEGEPFGVTMALAPCPWNEETLLLQIGLQARTVMPEERPPHNLVFLIDVSGSMFGRDRLDLVKQAFAMLVDELRPGDTVSIVTYASRDEIVLEGVPATEKTRILEAINGLEAGGSTNSAAGIRTAYALAGRYAVEGGVNRVIMATDGDFNVGMTSEADLARLIIEQKEAGIRLTMLGVGYGNYKDSKLEMLADYGDGNYYYLDSVFEARRALVTEAGGTFVEIARDVKLQLDFNPAMVSGYRLIGYEDRVMAAEDFDNDARDGGEVGSGHRVTVLYEIVPAGSAFDFGAPVSRYQQTPAGEANGEWLTLSIRAKLPGEDQSTLFTYPLTGEVLDEMPEYMRFAAGVAEAGMLLRGSEFSGTATWDTALGLIRSCPSVTGDALKEELVYLLTLLQRQN